MSTPAMRAAIRAVLTDASLSGAERFRRVQQITRAGDIQDNDNKEIAGNGNEVSEASSAAMEAVLQPHPKRARVDDKAEVVPSAGGADALDRMVFNAPDAHLNADLRVKRTLSSQYHGRSSEEEVGLLDSLFQDGDDGTGADPLPLYETVLIGSVSCAVRNKTLWSSKFPALKEKWRSEVSADPGFVDALVAAHWEDERDASAARAQFGAAIEFAFDELEHLYLPKSREVTSPDGDKFTVEAAAVDGVYKSDDAISSELRQAFISGANQLADAPESELDWHPGSIQQVLDLVHPSLFCLVRGVTRVIGNEHLVRQPVPWREFVGRGNILPLPSAQNERNRASAVLTRVKHALEAKLSGDEALVELLGNDPTKIAKPQDRPLSISKDSWESPLFQWLPAEFVVGDDGRVDINSYINNLDVRRHAPTYTAIARIFERFVPLFEETLGDMLHDTKQCRPSRLNAPKYSYYDNVEDDEDDEDDEDSDSDADRFHRAMKPSSIPATSAESNAGWIHWHATRQSISLRGRHLQVIVKIADIVLTPEKPSYAGGAWHVEGMKNESIVCTGIYYYATENITSDDSGKAAPTSLQFRTNVSEPDYEQSDDFGVKAVYGLENEEALVQHRGSVSTIEGRCIAFPNTLQHQVPGFRLLDPEKPGRRRVLVFFLVDPATRVLSTAAVPPQQRTVFENELSEGLAPGLFSSLGSAAVLASIHEFVGWPMRREEAELYRDELMRERKFFIGAHNERVFEREFSLCEH